MNPDPNFQEPDTRLHALKSGVRLLTLHIPQRATASVSVFVRTGSQHESRRMNGISHVVEHMAFKGTAARDCQRINLDAERLGAEVNAHTDKDHTAFHIDGRARDAGSFVQMLGDIVRTSTFPEAELERERQVILHELTEDEDDAMSTAFKLFDHACYGEHPFAQPVIGRRANIARFTRDELLAYVKSQYTAGKVIVGVAGGFDPNRIAREVEAAFSDMPAGSDDAVPSPAFRGGLKLRRLAGCAQTHAVLGFAIPSATQSPEAHVVAAALFGEGMSSPLLDQLRERRGLAYYAACSADVSALCGQFVVEASTSPAQAEELLVEVMRLLAEHAGHIDPVALERARNQLAVRSLRDAERPARSLETAVLDLYAQGRLRTAAERRARIEAVSSEQVRAAFAGMLAAGGAVALAGKVGPGVHERVAALVAPRH
jgi:predicted Zn-dependent peptidase